MSRQETLRVNNYQDTWAKLYLHLARTLCARYGADGEGLLRAGVRAFGVDRGLAQRAQHLAAGLKPNLANLFGKGDLPGDPRFRRNRIKLTEEERLSETLVCPIAFMWRAMDGMALGRVYCEEFHHAKFGAYAPLSQTNLSQTLTQEGDELCRFSVYLRPGNMHEAERAATFTAYDPNYDPASIKPLPPVPVQEGFGTLCLKLWQHLAVQVLDAHGHDGETCLREAAAQFVADMRCFLAERATQLNEPCDLTFKTANLPFGPASTAHEQGLWALYTDTRPRVLFQTCVAEPLYA